MMRFRMVTLTIALIGFLVINHLGNQNGQRLILRQIDTPEEVGQGLSAEDSRLESEYEVLTRMRVLIDTLDALGVETVDAVELRRDYRATMDHVERLRMSYFLSQALWRQTIRNMIWGIIVVIFLLPLAVMLDQRYPVGRIRPDADQDDGDPGHPGTDPETAFPA